MEVIDLGDLSKGTCDVLAERQRQKKELNWSAEHDLGYKNNELVMAAMNYADPLAAKPEHKETPPKAKLWPWELKWWRPSSYRRNLIKAIALLLAELDRHDAEQAQAKEPESKV
ncbi:TPA: hypothetical protein ACSCYS_003334 [Aeromonas veronii]